MSLFEIVSCDIERLDQNQLPSLLRRLLNLEADKYGICRSGVNVAGSISTPDGGVDGSIFWEGPPDSTGFLCSNKLIFQVKAQRMSANAAGKEVLAEPKNGKNHSIKPMVDALLGNGAGYILFTNTNFTQQQILQAIESIRERLRTYDKPYADDVYIDIFDRQKITDWTNLYLPAVLMVKSWLKQSPPHGFFCFEQWRDFHGFHQSEYFEDEALISIQTEIQNLISKTGSCSRIVGSSGIGKTRILFEACGKLNKTEKILYYDASIDSSIILKFLPQLYLNGGRYLLIIDNCSLNLHASIQKPIPNHLTIITVDHNLDESTSSDELVLPPVSSSVIGKIIKNGWPTINNEDLEKIVEYAAGLPLIASTLANDAVKGESNLGTLNDDVIKRKLLGESATSQDVIAIEALSLFDYLAFDNSDKAEYFYIAEHLAGMDPNDFYRSIGKFERRQLIDSRGGYKRVRVFPLSIRLAADWWGLNSIDYTSEVIELLGSDKSPGNLSKAFCKVVRRLDFVPRAVEVTSEFCGPDGPFCRSEMLKTAWGSLLFRAFVEVNPVATSNALYQVMERQTFGELKTNYVGDCRRNLYYALERLCFRSEVFENSAWALLRLAVAENESWANSCTGLFIQLFSPILSGTQADPDLRFRVLERAAALKDDNVNSLVVDGLESAIDTRRNGRIVGAEYQGLNQNLKDWRPQTVNELHDYQDRALAMLLRIAHTDSTGGVRAREVICNCLRGMIQRPDHNILHVGMEQLVERLHGKWPSGLDAIRSVRTHELGKMSGNFGKQISQMLDDWEARLVPQDIDDRIAQLLDTPHWDHHRDANGDIVDLSVARAKEFAKEFSVDYSPLIPFAHALVTGELRKGHVFGCELASLGSNHESFLDALLDEIRSAPKHIPVNCVVLSSYLSVLKTNQSGLYDDYIQTIFNDDELNKYFVECVCVDTLDEKYLSSILNLLKNNRLKINALGRLALGSVTSGIKTESLASFCDTILSLDKEYVWVCLDILYMHAHGEASSWQDVEASFVKLISVIDFSEQVKPAPMDLYHWEEVCKLLLKRGKKDLVEIIAEKIFLFANSDNTLTVSDHAVHSVLGELIHQGQFEPILNRVADVMRSGDHLYQYSVEVLLSGPPAKDGNSHFLEIPEKVWIDWAAENLDIGPELVAKFSPLYTELDGEYCCHSLAEKIAESYGNNKDVLNQLASFGGIKSWWGSRIPELMGEKKVFETFCEHSNPNVREWATTCLQHAKRLIESESQLEEAREFGVF